MKYLDSEFRDDKAMLMTQGVLKSWEGQKNLLGNFGKLRPAVVV
jgi:hypothetical protein